MGLVWEISLQMYFIKQSVFTIVGKNRHVPVVTVLYG